ncbi:MAG TPA: DUF3459 domain-containing protein, partial [Ktedonobacterales bacterium]
EWGASAPFLYFTDHQDAALGQAVREGRRREFAAFGWAPERIPDPQAAETFARSKLDWRELERPPHASLLAWYRALLRLRRDIPPLATGGLEAADAACDEDARWLALTRGPITLACNLADHAQSIPLRAGAGALKLLLASHMDTALEGQRAVSLPPDAVAIVRRDG